jgi:prepilin-type N-terminal cleavage/methylation domain-containing protein
MRKGFTLIELIIAMAVFIIIVVIAFGALSSYFAARTSNEQLIILQQNFRSAIDRIAMDFRQASSSPAISSPDGNKVSDTLTFTDADGSKISYYLGNGSSSGTSVIYKQVEGEIIPQPVTEEMHQLVKLYFVRSGGKIVVIIVGKTKFFASKNEEAVSFASMIFSRNANYEGEP